jgi:hypothetical protein
MDRMIIMGVSVYTQARFINEHGNNVWEGCGPLAGLMLMSTTTSATDTRS